MYLTQFLNFHFQKYNRNNCLQNHIFVTLLNKYAEAEVNLPSNIHIFVGLSARFTAADGSQVVRLDHTLMVVAGRTLIILRTSRHCIAFPRKALPPVFDLKRAFWQLFRFRNSTEIYYLT